MIEQLRIAVEALQQDAAMLPPRILIWMRVMMVVFALGIAFAPWWRQARWIVGVMLLTAVGLVAGKMLWPQVPRSNIGTVVQIALWTPLLAWLVLDLLRTGAAAGSRSGPARAAFLGWMLVAMAVMAVSLFFNFRTASQWL